MGLIYTTAGWDGAAITWTHADGAATYTVSGDALNALDVAVDLKAWLDAGARPWAAHISSVSLAVQDHGGRHRFAYSFTGSGPTFVSKTPNATWIARFGDTSASPVGDAPATCSVIPAANPWTRWDITPGVGSREGSFRSGHPATSHRRPAVVLCMDLIESYTFDECCRLAAQPRTAYLYDEGTGVWRLCRIGVHTPDKRGGVDPTGRDTTLEVLGLLDAAVTP